jgi:hypothetical protein
MPSKSPSSRGRSSTRGGGSGSRSPTSSPPSRKGKSPTAQFMEMLAKASVKDEASKTIKIPPFPDGTEWVSVMFVREFLPLPVWGNLKQFGTGIQLPLPGYTYWYYQYCFRDRNKFLSGQYKVVEKYTSESLY